MTQILYAPLDDKWKLTTTDELIAHLISTAELHEMRVSDLNGLKLSLTNDGIYINENAEFAAIKLQRLIEVIEATGEYYVSKRTPELHQPNNSTPSPPTSEDDYGGQVVIDGADR